MDPTLPSGGQPPGWAPPPGSSTAPPPAPGSWAPPGGQPGWPPSQPGWQPQGAWPTPQPWAPEPKRKRFGWVALTFAFLIGGFISFVVTFAGIIAIGLAIGSPDVIAGTHAAAAEGADVVAVGDCLSGEPGRASVVDQSDVVDCDEAHDAEVAAVLEIPGGRQRPGDDDLQTYLDDACLMAFEGYVDTDYDTSMYDYAADAPSKEAWADGDRTGFCLVDTYGALKGDGTVRGSGD